MVNTTNNPDRSDFHAYRNFQSDFPWKPAVKKAVEENEILGQELRRPETSEEKKIREKHRKNRFPQKVLKSSTFLQQSWKKRLAIKSTSFSRL